MTCARGRSSAASARGILSNWVASSSKPGSSILPATIALSFSVRCSGSLTSSKAINTNRRGRFGRQRGNKRSRQTGDTQGDRSNCLAVIRCRPNAIGHVAVTEDIARAGGQAVPIVADATGEGDIGKLFDAAAGGVREGRYFCC